MKGIVSFYEKPGCKGNEKQKELLRAAGYKLQVIDMISKNWDEEDLCKFFMSQLIHDCVNMTAPIIKSGELDPSKLTEEELMAEMIKTPILIKRPLIFFRGEFCCGFDTPLVAKLLGEKQPATKCLHKPGDEICP